ncbi:MAG: InlB B-repeat-containing protein [Alphaproteobacteria bacterium]|nr:InlB B-repeat-containing protein [Alphaproteobacteria bacterium]
MKKIIVSTFFLLFFSHGAFAATSCPTNATISTCSTNAGCYWQNSTASCSLCLSGHYNDGTKENLTNCTSCGTSPKGTSWDATQTGLESASKCKWTITCDAGQYYNGTECASCHGTGRYSTESETFSGYGTASSSTSQCSQKCGANSSTTSNGQACNCNNGYHTQDQNQTHVNNNSTDCIANQYTITYKSNNDKDETITQQVTFATQVSLKPNTTFTKQGYNLTGWKSTTQIYTTGYTFESYSFTNDITLEAVWSGKTFSITYDDNGVTDGTISTQTCTYNGTCKAESAAPYTYSGKYFTGWKCIYGCSDTTTLYKAGDTISTLSDGNDMTLQAQWQTCSAGYYCSTVTNQNPCPIGATSDAGATDIKKCYINNQTQFCDDNDNCYTIPGNNTKIYYQGGI